jgi:hypothetical protein
MPGYVIETNVCVAANGRDTHVTPKCAAAARSLLRASRSGVVYVDTGGACEGEYRRNLRASGEPGLGDEFFLWLCENQWHGTLIRRVAITPCVVADRPSYAEFPTDPRLESFDPSDRKWIAVALKCGERPTIYNATDLDYGEHAEALRDHGVNVVELCPDCLPPLPKSCP